MEKQLMRFFEAKGLDAVRCISVYQEGLTPEKLKELIREARNQGMIIEGFVPNCSAKGGRFYVIY